MADLTNGFKGKDLEYEECNEWNGVVNSGQRPRQKLALNAKVEREG